MSTPINREDIRKGDVIKISSVFIEGGCISDATYELIERPVVLPTEPGYYESERYPVVEGFGECQPYQPYQKSKYSGQWLLGNAKITEAEMKALLPLRRLKFVYDE